jgi:cyanophycinase
VVITNGNELEVVGSGAVVIVDGKDIQHSNITDISEGSPISIEGLKVNILVNGNGGKTSEQLRKNSRIVQEDVPSGWTSFR